MSDFYDALRAQYEPHLVCRCGAENIPGKPPVIHMEGTHAGCEQCGRYANFELFLRKDSKP